MFVLISDKVDSSTLIFEESCRICSLLAGDASTRPPTDECSSWDAVAGELEARERVAEERVSSDKVGGIFADSTCS